MCGVQWKFLNVKLKKTFNQFDIFLFCWWFWVAVYLNLYSINYFVYTVQIILYCIVFMYVDTWIHLNLSFDIMYKAYVSFWSQGFLKRLVYIDNFIDTVINCLNNWLFDYVMQKIFYFQMKPHRTHTQSYNFACIKLFTSRRFH